MSPTHSVLNTMTSIRLKYFNPQATKPFCTTEWEQTRLRHQSTVKGIYCNWKDLFYLNCKKCHESFQSEYIFLPRSIFFIIPNLMFSLTLSKCQSSIFWQVHFRIPVHLLSCSSQSLMSQNKGEKWKKKPQNLTSCCSYWNEEPWEQITVNYCTPATSVALHRQDRCTFLALGICGWKSGWRSDI